MGIVCVWEFSKNESVNVNTVLHKIQKYGAHENVDAVKCVEVVEMKYPNVHDDFFVPFLRHRAFILQNKDEKNQILTTNVWLNLVSGRSRARRLRRTRP